MTQGGFLEQKRRSPTGLALVLLLHGAVLAALLLAKGPQIIPVDFRPTAVSFVPEPVVPPDVVEPLPEPATRPSRIDVARPIVETPVERTVIEVDPLPDRFVPSPLPPGPDTRGETAGPPPAPRPAPPPVRVEASVDPRFARDLQPPYPASEQRAGNEGMVAVRVTIGMDGRVSAAERVSATSDAFWRTTERQALTRWRFRPATEDGRPVESRRVMTVHFELD